jgi:hypothetical protein
MYSRANAIIPCAWLSSFYIPGNHNLAPTHYALPIALATW